MGLFTALLEGDDCNHKVKFGYDKHGCVEDDIELGGPDEYGLDAADSIEDYQYHQEDDDRSDRDPDALMKESYLDDDIDAFLEADIDVDDLMSDEDDEVEPNGDTDNEFNYIQNGIDLHTVVPHNSESEQFSNADNSSLEESFTGWEDLL